MTDDSGRALFVSHERTFEANRYVYPVLSRRAGGISVGINLNRDKSCNFHCVYCQVDRSGPGESAPVDLGRLRDELEQMIERVASGRIFAETRFHETPPALRRLSDIAISGDGEPTLCVDFAAVVELCAEIRRRRKLDEVKIVLITNASLLDRDYVRRGLEILDTANGEIWAKLDAGTEEYYRTIARSGVSWQRILDNLAEAARARPIVVQSLFMRIHGQPPPPAELDAYCQRLRENVGGGGRIKLVQIHTIARPPAENWVAALSNADVDSIAELVRRQTGLPVAAFYA